ncbi:hypothetical protein CRUP_018900 [Coryphaenoides rupestris]|nr:hypothetical protein CRUP_018900 [Coryphaenoides rupestris]
MELMDVVVEKGGDKTPVDNHLSPSRWGGSAKSVTSDASLKSPDKRRVPGSIVLTLPHTITITTAGSPQGMNRSPQHYRGSPQHLNVQRLEEMYNQMTKSQSYTNLNTTSSMSTLSTSMTALPSPVKKPNSPDDTVRKEVELEMKEVPPSSTEGSNDYTEETKEDNPNSAEEGDGKRQDSPPEPDLLVAGGDQHLLQDFLVMDDVSQMVPVHSGDRRLPSNTDSVGESFSDIAENIRSSLRGGNHKPLGTHGSRVNSVDTSAEGPPTPPSTISPDVSSNFLEDITPEGETSPLIPRSEELVQEETRSLSPERLVVDTPPGEDDPSTESEQQRRRLADMIGGAIPVAPPPSPKELAMAGVASSAQNCTQGSVGGGGSSQEVEADGNQSTHKVENHMFTPEIHLIPGEGSLSPGCETSM